MGTEEVTCFYIIFTRGHIAVHDCILTIYFLMWKKMHVRVPPSCMSFFHSLLCVVLMHFFKILLVVILDEIMRMHWFVNELISAAHWLSFCRFILELHYFILLLWIKPLVPSVHFHKSLMIVHPPSGATVCTKCICLLLLLNSPVSVLLWLLT